MSFHRLQPFRAPAPFVGAEINFEVPEVMRLRSLASESLAGYKGFCEGLLDMSHFTDSLLLLEAIDIILMEWSHWSHADIFEAIASGATAHEPVRSILACKQAAHLGHVRLRGRRNLILLSDLGDLAATVGVKHVARDIWNHGDRLNQFAALEELLNNPQRSSEDPLIKLALIHYQFESIRPFGQEEDRTGRLLNALYLVQQSLMPIPIMTLSGYFRRNRKEYRANLAGIARDGRWIDWVIFVLNGVRESAERAQTTLRRMKELKSKLAFATKQGLGVHCKLDFLPLLCRFNYFNKEQLRGIPNLTEEMANHIVEHLLDRRLLSTTWIGGRFYFENHALREIMEEY